MMRPHPKPVADSSFNEQGGDGVGGMSMCEARATGSVRGSRACRRPAAASELVPSRSESGYNS